MLMAFILSTGCALLLSALNVFFRDFTHLTEVLLRALFYLTPILYPPGLFGPVMEALLKLNPAYYPIVAARDALYYHRISPIEVWVSGYALGLFILLFGVSVFTRNESKFVYYA